LTIPVRNMSTQLAPLGGFAEVYDYEDGFYLFRQPQADNALTCYILTADVEPTRTGLAWDRGITSDMLIDGGANAGDLVGSVEDQWYGRVSIGGTFVAVAPDRVTL